MKIIKAFANLIRKSVHPLWREGFPERGENGRSDNVFVLRENRTITIDYAIVVNLGVEEEIRWQKHTGELLLWSPVPDTINGEGTPSGFWDGYLICGQTRKG